MALIISTAITKGMLQNVNVYQNMLTYVPIVYGCLLTHTIDGNADECVG